eukprot:TRINITY_DN15253_c0_g1_i1.p1 TRINITY_DN15253_c0_g1~~TRINITY_DN15253_c0_g1_i1.p1  ORF type:complete len:543 (+),score=132.06 TRINITY_DN15253_c0_g1_i1:247-1875(+)
MSDPYMTAQMRALPGHAIKRDPDDDLARTQKGKSGVTVAARATVDVSNVGPHYKFKGAAADPWVTTNNDMLRPQPQVGVLQQPENKKAPLNDSVYFLDSEVYREDRQHSKGLERLGPSNFKTQTQRTFTTPQAGDPEIKVLAKANARIQQELQETMAKVARPMVTTDPVAVGLHFRTTNNAAHVPFDKGQQDMYTTHGDPSKNPVTVWSQPPKKVGYPNNETAGDGKRPKGAAAKSTYTEPSNLQGTVRPVAAPPSISQQKQAVLDLPETARPHFAPHVGFGARSTYAASYIPKKPVVEPEPELTQTQKVQAAMQRELAKPAIDAFARTSQQLGQKPLEPEPEEFQVDRVLKKMRERIKSRGAVGINRLGRHFRIIDDSGDGQLDLAELKKCLTEYGFGLDDSEFAEVAAMLDRDGSGTVDYNEFLRAVRGPMNAKRMAIVGLAFDKLDVDKNGYLDLNDIKAFYNAKGHPKVLSGEKTEDDVLREYLDKFDTISKDGKVMRDEFVEYYQNISISIDNDDHFELMMRNSWKLNPKVLNRLKY